MRFSQSGRLEQQALPVPVLGDEADAGLRRCRVFQCEMSSPASRIVPATVGRMPMIASTSSAWPLPSTPAMPDDLALRGSTG